MSIGDFLITQILYLFDSTAHHSRIKWGLLRQFITSIHNMIISLNYFLFFYNVITLLFYCILLSEKYRFGLLQKIHPVWNVLNDIFKILQTSCLQHPPTFVETLAFETNKTESWWSAKQHDFFINRCSFIWFTAWIIIQMYQGNQKYMMSI